MYTFHLKTAFIALTLSCLSLGLQANNTETQEDCNCPAVTDVTTSSSLTNLKVNWQTNPAHSGYALELLKGGVVYSRAIASGGTTTFKGVSPATNYTIRIHGICSDQQSGSVSVDVTTPNLASFCGLSWDAGDDLDHPSPFNMMVNEWINAEGDVDVFAFKLEQPQAFTATLGRMTNDYELTVLGSGVFKASDNPGTTNETIDISLAEAQSMLENGSIYLMVTPWNNAYNTYNCYKLSLSFSEFNVEIGDQLGITTDDQSMMVNVNSSKKTADIQFDMPFERNDDLKVQLLSADGRTLHQEAMTMLAGQQSLEVEMPVLVNGVYFLHVSGSFGQKTVRFAVTK